MDQFLFFEKNGERQHVNDFGKKMDGSKVWKSGQHVIPVYLSTKNIENQKCGQFF